MNRSTDHDQGLTSDAFGPLDPSELDDSFGEDFLDETVEFETDEDPEHEVPAEEETPPAAEPSGGGGAAMAAWISGALLVLGGIALAFAWSQDEALRSAVERFGVAPAHLVVAGLLLAGVAGMRRRMVAQDRALAHLHTLTTSVLEAGEHGEGQLSYLVEAETSRGDGESRVSQDVHHAIHLIQRQDEKIANLTKATKMYGKPLLEITNQISDSGHQVSEVARTLNTVKVIIEQATGRLENAVRAGSRQIGTEDLSKIEAGLRRLEEAHREVSHRLVAKSETLEEEVGKATRRLLDRLEGVQNDLASGMRGSGDQLANTVEERLAAGLRQTSERLAGQLEELAEAVRGSGDRVAATVEKRVADALQESTRVLHEELAKLAKLEQQAARQPAGDGTPDGALAETLGSIRDELDSLARGIEGLKNEPARGGARGTGSGSSATTDAGAGDAGGNDDKVKNAIAKLRQLRK